MCEDEKLTGFVKDVADAIREVEGSSDQIKPVDFPERIKNLSSSSGFIYNVDTVDETGVPTADLEKLKSDPNAMIIETYTVALVNFKIYYRKMFKSGDTYDRFISVYSTANEEHINQSTIRAYRDLNYSTSKLSQKHTVNIVNQDQLDGYLRRPTDNPTEDSLVEVSSTGGISWKSVGDFLEKNKTTSDVARAYAITDKGVQKMWRMSKNYPEDDTIALRSSYGNVRGVNPPRNDNDYVVKKYMEDNFIPSTTVQRIVPADGATVTLAELGAANYGFCYVSGYAIKGNGTDLPRGYYWITKQSSSTTTGDISVIAINSVNEMFILTGSIAGNPAIKGWYKIATQPADNPTEDSLLKVSSTGTNSWQPKSELAQRYQDNALIAHNNEFNFVTKEGTISQGYVWINYRAADGTRTTPIKKYYLSTGAADSKNARLSVGDAEDAGDAVNLKTLGAKYNANPTLDGTEAELTSVTIDGTKYKVPSGGGSGDVTAAGDNTFTGSNIFKKAITLYTDAANGNYISATLDSYKLELHHDLASTQANLNITDETNPYLELKTAGHGKVKYTQESIIYTDTIGNQKTTTLKLPGQGATTDSTQTIATLDDCYTYIDKTLTGSPIVTSTTTTFTADEMTQIYNNYGTTVIHLISYEGGSTKPVEKFLYPYGKAQETNFFIFISPVYNNYQYVLTVSGSAGATATATIARVGVGAKPSGNPTKDSVVKVSSTGTVSYLGIDTTATSASTNLITSGAVAAVEYSLSQSIAGCATEPDISTFPEDDDAFFIGEKTSHASKWLPKKQMTLKSHKIHFDAFDSGSTVGQYDDAFISVLCYTETPFTVDTLTTFMLATGQSYPVCSPSYGMVGYVRVSNAAGDITWEDKEGNNIALAGINESSYVVTDIQSFFPFE